MQRSQTLVNSLVLCFFLAISQCSPLEEKAKEIDALIESDISEKMAEDLLQSIERKFQVDLERSVDQVLLKIKVLLKNGSTAIQDKLHAMEGQLADLRVTLQDNKEVVDRCLAARQDATVALAEGALHQMVLCGYALIGHEPARALASVVQMKDLIRTGLQPLHEKTGDVLDVLKMCAHDHDSLKKVIKCVIAKSPEIKIAMMDISGKLSAGVTELTKLMAHGAMHEACLVEVVQAVEDDAAAIIDGVRTCALGASNGTINLRANVNDEVAKYIQSNNATVLDIVSNKTKSDIVATHEKNLDETKLPNVGNSITDSIMSESNNDVGKQVDDAIKSSYVPQPSMADNYIKNALNISSNLL